MHVFGIGFDIDSAQTLNELQPGGKARNLIRLSELGFRVPPFFVIPASAFHYVVEQSPEIQTAIRKVVDATDGERGKPCEELRNLIADCQWPEQLTSDFGGAYERLAERGASQEKRCLVAVRSSATDEDGVDHSFAGMHDSFLFVDGVQQALLNARKVWASAFNDRAIAYRLENGLAIDAIAVGVVIQQMIDPSVSGVCFTCNPANGRTDEMLVSSVFGAGEGLVSAGFDADTFTLNKRTRGFTSDIAEKKQQLVLNESAGSGLLETTVPESLQNVASLDEERLNTIAITALEIEKAFRRPQDIEFCFDRDYQLYVLQSRPVTRMEQFGPALENRLVWDNSNIIESYSGVTTPMTFSFIRRAYTIVYHCFAEVMGISPRKVKASRHVFENMLGLIRGRVFYNLQNWYRLIRLFPGFQYNASAMETMMGLKEPLILEDASPNPGFFRKWFVEFPALAKLVVRTGWNFGRIRTIVRKFDNRFREHYDRWDELDFREMASHELMKLHDEMEDTLLWNWRAPIINDFYVMIYFGMLKKLCKQWAMDETGALQNDLICGEGGIESAEPAKMLLRLAGIANKTPELRDEICTGELDDLPVRISRQSRYDEFNDMMAEYLDLYGFRCMNELKLEEYSLRDRPQMVYQVLRNYLQLEDQSVLDVDAMHAREQKIRREAESRAFDALGGFRLVPRQTVFRHVLRCARLGVKNRENMRFARTRIYGLLREILRAMGNHFADEGILDDPEDIFYLTIDEVWDFVKGTAVSTRLKDLATLRRAEFDEYRRQADPDDRFETYGFVYHRNEFKGEEDRTTELPDGQLQGIGCCPGVVERETRVLASPSDNMSLSGEILVAQRTDPGWVPLYPAVSGILIERGSVLSHSAVVAREMGIPTIVGIRGLLEHVQDGDVVRMDGAAGIAEIVQKNSANPHEPLEQDD